MAEIVTIWNIREIFEPGVSKLGAEVVVIASKQTSVAPDKNSDPN